MPMTAQVRDTAAGTSTYDHPVGWRRYLYSTNHKDIGTMYLAFAIVAGLIGGVFSIAMRMELRGGSVCLNSSGLPLSLYSAVTALA